jgi:hypothetical protein
MDVRRQWHDPCLPGDSGMAIAYGGVSNCENAWNTETEHGGGTGFAVVRNSLASVMQYREAWRDD